MLLCGTQQHANRRPRNVGKGSKALGAACGTLPMPSDVQVLLTAAVREPAVGCSAYGPAVTAIASASNTCKLWWEQHQPAVGGSAYDPAVTAIASAWLGSSCIDLHWRCASRWRPVSLPSRASSTLECGGHGCIRGWSFSWASRPSHERKRTRWPILPPVYTGRLAMGYVEVFLQCTLETNMPQDVHSVGASGASSPKRGRGKWGRSAGDKYATGRLETNIPQVGWRQICHRTEDLQSIGIGPLQWKKIITNMPW